MNRDPFQRRTKLLATTTTLTMLISACSGPPEDERRPSSETPAPTTTMPPTLPAPPASGLGVVFCDRLPGEGTPSTGPGSSNFFFLTGNAQNPGRELAILVATLGPPPPNAPPGTQADLGYSWSFSPDLPEPDPATVRERASVRFNDITYVMGVTAVVRQNVPQLDSFCAPEGSPSIPPPLVTLPPTPPIATI